MQTKTNHGLPAACRLGALALAALLGAGTAQAGYVDTVAAREWRQLTETTGTSWTAAAAKCDPTTGVCGGDWAGWTWASIDDVRQLFSALGVPMATANATATNSSWAPAILDMDGPGGADTGAFHVTRFDQDYQAYINGWVRTTLSQSTAYAPVIIDNFDAQALDYAWTGEETALHVDLAGDVLGVFLYRAVDTGPGNEVPEPGSAALLGLGIAGLAALRRRRPG